VEEALDSRRVVRRVVARDRAAEGIPDQHQIVVRRNSLDQRPVFARIVVHGLIQPGGHRVAVAQPQAVEATDPAHFGHAVEHAGKRCLGGKAGRRFQKDLVYAVVISVTFRV
jgi:hypothetical protein